MNNGYSGGPTAITGRQPQREALQEDKAGHGYRYLCLYACTCTCLYAVAVVRQGNSAARKALEETRQAVETSVLAKKNVLMQVAKKREQLKEQVTPPNRHASYTCG